MTSMVETVWGTVGSFLDAVERRFTFRSALAAFLLLNLEIALLATYVLVGPQQITDWVPVLVPFVWINVGLAAIVWTTVEPASRRDRLLALLIAIGYFLVLAYFGGLIGRGHTDVGTTGRIAIASIPPGWAPTLLANTPSVRVSIVFYQFVGYVALAYLVYATVIDASGSAIGGLVGLFSCVSCTWPILGSILTSVFGSGTAVVVFAQDWTYALSTVIFLATVALLYWRPGIGRVTT